mmetsp:Transcript_18242/g.54552  ORF Transcript_18242/g.54552 Transcript_18242/m.54552 type:complete len:230 (-) Transcript_18242:402-1091(-)
MVQGRLRKPLREKLEHVVGRRHARLGRLGRFSGGQVAGHAAERRGADREAHGDSALVPVEARKAEGHRRCREGAVQPRRRSLSQQRHERNATHAHRLAHQVEVAAQSRGQQARGGLCLVLTLLAPHADHALGSGLADHFLKANQNHVDALQVHLQRAQPRLRVGQGEVGGIHIPREGRHREGSGPAAHRCRAVEAGPLLRRVRLPFGHREEAAEHVLLLVLWRSAKAVG